MKALSPTEFARLMDRLGPFEPAPRLAVAVSGGGDSLAAALLAAHWAHDRGGRVVALTVDHRLRPNSSAEAALVGQWLGQHGISHHVLPWLGDKPASDLQGRARAARYELLAQWCRRAGVLHVVLAHHREDQAETFLLRLARGSGVDGLSAMAAVRHDARLRWLRPLLAVPKARLLATLRERDQPWVEDPSNTESRHARVRLRRLAPVLAAEGLDAVRLSETAARLGQVRDLLESDQAGALLRWAEINPAGHAWVEMAAWSRLPEPLALRLLSRLVQTLGGEALPPRLERSDGLLRRLRQGQGGTLSGCRVAVVGERALFCREAGRMAAAVGVAPGAEVEWDGRFRLSLAAAAPSGLSLGGLGSQGWGRVAQAVGRSCRPPALVRPVLPALFDQRGVFAVPHLGYNREGQDAGALFRLWPAFRRPLTEIAHCLA